MTLETELELLPRLIADIAEPLVTALPAELRPGEAPGVEETYPFGLNLTNAAEHHPERMTHSHFAYRSTA